MTATTPTRTFNGVTIPVLGTFAIDPAHSTVGFTARHIVISKVRGSFERFGGTITIADDPLASSVEVSIEAASVTTGVADRDNHLRSGEFLGTEEFPNLTYRSTSVKEHSEGSLLVGGELTIRGVSHPVDLQVEYDGVIQTPAGETIAFTATTEIDREQWGITWNHALEAGGVMVGKLVKIEIIVQAHRSA